MSEERIREDWGGYEPETQKALRFVAIHDIGAAKQIAAAISQEYGTEDSLKQWFDKQEAILNSIIESINQVLQGCELLDSKDPKWSLFIPTKDRTIPTYKIAEYLRNARTEASNSLFRLKNARKISL